MLGDEKLENRSPAEQTLVPLPVPVQSVSSHESAGPAYQGQGRLARVRGDRRHLDRLFVNRILPKHLFGRLDRGNVQVNHHGLLP